MYNHYLRSLAQLQEQSHWKEYNHNSPQVRAIYLDERKTLSSIQSTKGNNYVNS